MLFFLRTFQCFNLILFLQCFNQVMIYMLLIIIGHIYLELLKINYLITLIQVGQDRNTQRNTYTDIRAEHRYSERTNS